MTVPQIVSWVGWTLATLFGLFTILHTINLIIPRVDLLIATSHLGAAAYAISIPVLIVGVAIGVAGHTLERRDERQYEDRENL